MPSSLRTDIERIEQELFENRRLLNRILTRIEDLHGEVEQARNKIAARAILADSKNAARKYGGGAVKEQRLKGS